MIAITLAQNAPPFDLPVGSDYILATLVVGFLMSPIISALNRSTWDSTARAIAAFVWCAVAAGLLLLAGGKFDWGVRPTGAVLFSTLLTVFVMAISLYRFYYQPSGISDKIDKATG